MLRMSNYYYFVFSLILIFTIFCNYNVITKIESTIALINQELVYECVTYQGLIEANENNDSKYLYINQMLLKQVVKEIINSNLTITNNKIEYYFYDNTTLINNHPGKNYCNSVQIKISINYQRIN